MVIKLGLHLKIDTMIILKNPVCQIFEKELSNKI